MAESEIPQKKEAWTTGEELLLACAVERHGVKDWDSVAMEVQARTSLLPLILTPQNCERKYADLKRRFMDSGGESDSGDPTGFDIPWLDELRKLRVAELRREVHRYDVSILSLQFKVKKMKDGDWSSKEVENKTGKSDLEKDWQEESLDNEEKDGAGDSPEQETAGKSVPGEENQSCNESNSTGAKDENTNAGSGDAVYEPDLVRTGSREPDPDSFKGSTDTREAKRAEPSGGESRDRMAESKGEDGTKESSDVQSCASPTRSRRRRRTDKEAAAAACSSGEEPGTDGGFPATMKINYVESEPVVALLQFIRSHEHSSLFAHPPECQEYESLVKQHVDLQTIEARLRQGSYSSSTAKFSRDLLLLLTNFIVFFPKSSPESTAAHEMRRLVSHYQLEKQTPASSETLPPPLPPPQPDAPANPDSLLAKDKPPAAPMIVCRKRSSLSVAKKAEIQSDDKKLAAVDARPSARPSRRLSSIEDKEKETAAVAAMTGIRSSRRSTKNSPAAAAATADDSPAKKQASSHTDGASKAEKTKAASTGPSRKRGAAVDFLERIKLNSSPAGKNDSGGGGGSKAEPQKARGGGRNGGNAQQGGDQKGDGGSLLRSGGGKQAKEEESLSRRSNARRPLKKVADLTSKRKRAGEGEEEEAAGKETAVASNRRRKRVRR